MQQQLRDAGLTENESKVYISLLEIGPSNAGAITKKSGLHRRVVYDVLDMLVKKGLIGYILKNNIRVFQASNPERFLEILREKEEVIGEIMPNMISLYRKTREKEETNFYKGKRGLRNVFEDQLECGKEVLILGASSLAYEVMQYYFKWYDKRRKSKKIRARIIFHDVDKNIKVPFSEIRYLPQKYASPVAINIYGDKIALILWQKEDPIAILIKNKDMAEGYKQYFELMWNISKRAR
jgi:sugar-specific transcriptional regulator TrmB